LADLVGGESEPGGGRKKRLLLVLHNGRVKFLKKGKEAKGERRRVRPQWGNAKAGVETEIELN